MAAKVTLVSFALLLAPVAAMAFAFPTTTTTTVKSSSSSSGSVPVGDVPTLPFPFPLPNGGDAAEAVEECLKTVLRAEGCAVDILRWFASPDLAVHVSPVCCGMLQRVGDRCIRGLFPASPFGQFYAPLVRNACDVPKSSNTPGAGGRQ